MNIDRLVCGMATVFDQPGRDGTALWRADAFKDFLGLHMAIPLRVDHGPLITTRGVIANVGTARRFAVVTQPVAGLLCLAEVDHAGGWGDQILADIQSILAQQWLPPAWGMSIGALTIEDGGAALPYEVSLTRNPFYEDAKVVAVGPDAVRVWELLTGIRPNAPAYTADRW